MILHVDMDAFFASVEQLDDPSLRGKPVLVGGAGRRGVVAAASYEARVFGCHSAQPMAIALRRCPDAIVCPPRGGRYHELSRQVFEILGSFTPLVEPLSIDEAFLDVSGTERLHGAAPDVARSIKSRVREETGLAASIGVAPNKFLAKLASDLDKPDGLTIIDEAWIRDRLPAQPIRRMWGVGPATEQRLTRLGIRTFGDLASRSVQELRRMLGQDADRLSALARGRDHRRVRTDAPVRSVSHEQTFERNITEPQRVRAVLINQMDLVARRLRRRGERARTVTVKIRYGDFETITRSTTLAEATDRSDRLREAAGALFDRWAGGSFQPVRLIGGGVSHMTTDAPQTELFGADDEKRQQRIDRTTDAIQDRFGARSIRRGG